MSARRSSSLLVAWLLGACSDAAPGVSSAGLAFSGVPPASAITTGSATSEAAPKPDGLLHYRVVDAATHAPIPCKLTFLGVGNTLEPAFSRSDEPRQETRAIAAYNRVFSLGGEGSLKVPIGLYTVLVSRGLEWTLVERNVEITREGARLDAELLHVIETPGWVSADFHVHASGSFDSKVPMDARVYEFVSDGVDMIVSTDHNVITDYGPIIETLGARAWLASTAGDEVTTPYWGHFGVFPLPLTDSPPRNGAVQTRGRTPKQIFEAVRKKFKDSIINVNHPRFDKGLGYFTIGGMNAKTRKAKRQGFSFDFDAIEILNGYQDFERQQVEEVMQDWFGLLQNGQVATATGNSDTHHLHYNLGGYPRNYVAVLDDAPSRVTPQAVAAGLRAHRSFFTTGPVLSLTSGTAQMGDLVTPVNGKVSLHITVRAAPWVPVDRVTLYQLGKVVQTFEVSQVAVPLRFDQTIERSVAGDDFFVVTAEGNTALPAVVGDGDAFKVLPFALTNPILVDADGDGRFRPKH